MNSPGRFTFSVSGHKFTLEGTAFYLGALDNTDYDLVVTRGSVGIQPEDGTWSKIIVQENFRAMGAVGSYPVIEEFAAEKYGLKEPDPEEVAKQGDDIPLPKPLPKRETGVGSPSELSPHGLSVQ